MFGMPGRRCEQRRTAISTKVARQFIAAIATFRKSFGLPENDFEMANLNAHADIKCATGAAAAVGAMAITRGAKWTAVFVTNVAAKTPTGKVIRTH